MIYLDYAANTPVEEKVLACFNKAARTYFGNANAQHEAGFCAKMALADITASIADLLGAKPEEIIYTSGATESNNTAVRGLVAAQKGRGKHIITTPLEHASIWEPLQALQKQGYRVDCLSLDAEGQINLNELKSLLQQDTILLTVCAVDSELGIRQPLAEIAALLRAYPGCRWHVDATQAMGKIPLALERIDTMSFAPHKFYGLNGSGILYKRKNMELSPLLTGGGSTTPYRSGTPAVALAAAAECALRLALTRQQENWQDVSLKQKFLVNQLNRYSGVHINSPSQASPYILNLSVDEVRGQRFQKLLNTYGVCVSVKSACALDGQPSRAVLAVNSDYRNALCAWRISLSSLTTKQELQKFLKIFDLCYKKLRSEV